VLQRIVGNLRLVLASALLGLIAAMCFMGKPLALVGTSYIIIAAFAVRSLPASVRAGVAALQQIDPSIEEASINLGVPPVLSFVKVVLPLMLPGIFAGAVIMWVTTLAELSSTIVLYYGPWATMTVEIFQRIGSGDFGPASSYATILILSVLIPLFILNRVSGRDLASSL